MQKLRANDLTELPGLDELSNPAGCIEDLEKCAAELWQSRQSIISVNGATAGLLAALLAVADRGKDILVPTNAHRSVANGLVLTGLNPIWYQPEWDPDWAVWGSASADSVSSALAKSNDVAAVVLVSPTYPGSLSDVSAIATICRKKNIPLIVDEAHGAHLLPQGAVQGALQQGADIVVHSLHKTLPALTQTGIVHNGKQSLVPDERLRSSLNLVQSSSPSYPMLLSIEETIDQCIGQCGTETLARLARQCANLRSNLPRSIECYSPSFTEPLHILVRPAHGSATDLDNHLRARGVFAETLIGSGLLLLLGFGTTDEHITLLLEALHAYQPSAGSRSAETKEATPPMPEQVLTPRSAYFAPTETLLLHNAIGRIAAETVAPCPPGTAAVIAGQRVPPQILEFASLQKLKVVVE